MKKDKFVYSWHFLIVCTLVFILGLGIGEMREMYASGSRIDALKAYKKMLSKQTIAISGQNFNSKNIYFSLGYLDSDNVPEISLMVDGMAPYAIYTYYNKKVCLVAKMNGLWPYYGFQKTGVFFKSIYSDGFSPGSIFYRYSRGKSYKLFRYKRVYERWPDDGKGDYSYKYAFYDANDNPIGFSKFASLYKKYTKEQFPSIFGATKARVEVFRTAYNKLRGNTTFPNRFYRNTKQNRVRYLR